MSSGQGNSYYSSTNYSSYSSSSSSGGQTTGHRYAEQSSTTPSGSTFQSASQRAGEPVVTESRSYDASGRPLVEGQGGGQSRIESGRVQEIDDEAARKYEERIEDEYAKREGGA